MSSSRFTKCDICGLPCKAKGLASHKRRCEKEQLARQSMREYLAAEHDEHPSHRSVSVAASTSPPPKSPEAVDSRSTIPEPLQVTVVPEMDDSRDEAPSSVEMDLPAPSLSLPSEDPVATTLNDLDLSTLGKDDIITEYHPRSQRAISVTSFGKWRLKEDDDYIPEEKPWAPFATRLDFEFSELALEAALNKEQRGRLIGLINSAVALRDDNEQKFTLRNATDMEACWKSAGNKRVKFQKHKITATYKKEDRKFDFTYRDPWDWALELIRDPEIAPHLVWDAEKLYHWDGERIERIYDEPWTAEMFWQAQSRLPDDTPKAKDAKIVAFILYADRDKLSDFGTHKGYPIIARLANLPISIRNSEGVAGGRVVGWLPIVHEDTKETGKPGFVNFKNVVWHASFRLFLEKIASRSAEGEWVECGDKILRWLWAIVLILSADYEEFSVMTLNRGVRSLFPCPKCLVPKDSLNDLLRMFQLRTQKHSRMVFEEACKKRTKAEGEIHLKGFGLRRVKNAFWGIQNSDVHLAASYDVLHTDDGGLWEDHFFKEFKAIVKDRTDIVRIDSFFAQMPRWRELNHFDSVMNITFNDGSKNFDISKVMIFLFAAQQTLSQDRESHGYLLLRCLRAYLNVRMYADLNVHTESTISDGLHELEDRFAILMKEYIDLFHADDQDTVTPPNPTGESESDDSGDEGDSEPSTSIQQARPNSNDSESDEEDEDDWELDESASTANLAQSATQQVNTEDPEAGGEKIKSWNFPKLHLRRHLFDDILLKGVTRNYNTKPNEKMHGPIRKSYLRRSNYKNFGDQILEADHRLYVSSLIRSKIDRLDTYHKSVRPESTQTLGSTSTTKSLVEIPQLPHPSTSSGSSPGLSYATVDGTVQTEEYDQYRHLGSRVQLPRGRHYLSFEEFEQDPNHRSAAFSNFRIRLGQFLTTFLHDYGIALPDNAIYAGNQVRFKATDRVIAQYQYLKVQYVSEADWTLKTDHIRCNPEFYGQPRYDCVLVNSNPNFYARLHALFTCDINGVHYSFALIQPFRSTFRDARRLIKDVDLEFLRLQEMPLKATRFISVNSIIRGAVVVPAGDVGSNESRDYYLFDLLDGDMFLRGRSEIKSLLDG